MLGLAVPPLVAIVAAEIEDRGNPREVVTVRAAPAEDNPSELGDLGRSEDVTFDRAAQGFGKCVGLELLERRAEFGSNVEVCEQCRGAGRRQRGDGLKRFHRAPRVGAAHEQVVEPLDDERSKPGEAGGFGLDPLVEPSARAVEKKVEVPEPCLGVLDLEDAMRVRKGGRRRTRESRDECRGASEG